MPSAFAFFFNPTRGRLTLPEVLSDVLAFIEEDHKHKYEILIGTDGNGGGNGAVAVDLVSVIVVHRIGVGARYYWHTRSLGKVPTLRQKIYAEVQASIDLGKLVLEELSRQQLKLQDPEQLLAIHVDIGEKGQTRELIREIVGMVKAHGFTVYIKPTAVAASVVADKHT
jgi:hypothetical protein